MYITPKEYIPGTIRHINKQKRKKGNQGTRNRTSYKDVISAFDIETSRLPDIEQSIMYVWAFHLHHHFTMVGRTWKEFDEFIKIVIDELGDDTLCIFVHNLAYEFQFLQAIYDFTEEEVFAVDNRKVLKCSMYGGKIEFRCSYLHSNMSLDEFTKKMGAKHLKLDGEEFDYKEIRYPWTPLTDKQIQYVSHDVIGLCEAIEIEMQSDQDNLYTYPLTSTGYVRRDAKKAMRSIPKAFVQEQLADIDVYTLLREAFRGGNTHANRYYAGKILENVKSADRSSSYPEVLCNCQFPISPFLKVQKPSFERLMYLMNDRKKAMLIRVSITNLRLRDRFWGCPYLSKDKCRKIETGVYDNGRILSADYLETSLTDIDLRILLDEYDFDDMCPFDMYYSRYGKLPKPFIDTVISYYVAKTTLKNVDGQEIFYMKSKNKLNSLYGMCAQDPVKASTKFIHGDWVQDALDRELAEELLNKNNEKAWLPYQWGVWCTAHARYALECGIKLAGDNFVYADTDSVKYVGEIDWTEYNNERIKDSLESGAYATDPQGETHYMGVYEDDGFYKTFKTLGAKKYAYTYEENGKTFVTIAGVNKKKGGKELDKYGGLEAFKPGFIFVEAGGTESVYNDHPEIEEIEREGRKIKITPNVVIRDSVYTLGITEEYDTLLKLSKKLLDFFRVL